ncbi:MAG TPA: ferredoxin [Mycobacteriales bacterium]|nr:ferredoxin [Mycobacteriales bacterium]
MKVIIDPDKCCGYGECVATAPGLFEIGDDNRAHLLRDGELSGPDAELARDASYSCPVEAIDIAE